MLVTYSHLLHALLAPPPTMSSLDIPPDWRKHAEWLSVMSQNLMAAANDLRPVQARGNLESMMRRQLELRRQETVDIHAYVGTCTSSSMMLTSQRKCDSLEARLNEMSEGVFKVAGDDDMDVDDAPGSSSQQQGSRQMVSKIITSPATSLLTSGTRVTLLSLSQQKTFSAGQRK